MTRPNDSMDDTAPTFRQTLGKFIFRFRDGLPVVLVILVVTGVLSLLFGWARVPQFINGTLFQRLGFNFPVYLDIDRDERLYVIDSNSRRITSLDAKGHVRWTIDGGQRGGGFYESIRLAAVGDGGLCVYNTVYDPATGSIEAEEILLYGPDGLLIGPVVRSTEPAETLLSFEVRSGVLQYFRKLDGRLYLYAVNLSDMKRSPDPATHDLLMSAPCPIDFVAIKPYPGDRFLMSDRSGRLVLFDKSGKTETLEVGLGGPAGGKFLKPWDIKAGADGALYVLDMLLQNMYRLPLEPGGSAEPVFGIGDVRAAGMDNPVFEYMAVSKSGTLGLVDKFNHSVWLKQADGRIECITGGTMAGEYQAMGIFSLALVGLFLVSTLLSIVFLFRRLFAESVSVMVKQVSILLPLVVISVVVGTSRLLILIQDRYESQVTTKLEVVAGLGARMIDGSLLDRINQASDLKGPAHSTLLDQTASIIGANGASWNKDFGVVVYKVVDDRFYMVRTSSSYYGIMFPFGKPTRQHQAAARSGAISNCTYYDEFGGWICGLAPLRNASGTITGVLEIYHNLYFMKELENGFNIRLVAGILAIVLVVILLLVVVDIILFLSLNSLRRASRQVNEGRWGITVGARRRDEIGDLSRDFNTMSIKLKDYFFRLEEMRDANARFVPVEFIKFLGKESIADVRSGEQKRRQFTLFFADIRSFTTLSEGMTPKENFDFINSYLSVMGPVIREHGGFIDRYLGDAIMALFPDSPGQAARAALKMHDMLRGFNAERRAAGKSPIDFGVGIHSEEVILGVLGEERRLSATVVSDAVDLVNRLEGLTKRHGMGIIISADAFEGLEPELKGVCVPVGTIDYDDGDLPVYGLDLAKAD